MSHKRKKPTPTPAGVVTEPKDDARTPGQIRQEVEKHIAKRRRITIRLPKRRKAREIVRLELARRF